MVVLPGSAAIGKPSGWSSAQRLRQADMGSQNSRSLATPPHGPYHETRYFPASAKENGQSTTEAEISKFFLGLAILFSICGGVVRADEQSDAIAILDAGIKAQGGETAMGKPVGIHFKLKGSAYDNGTKSPISVEMYCWGRKTS